MPKLRNWTLILVPDDESGTRQLHLSGRGLRVLVVLALLAAVAFGVAAALYGRLTRSALEAGRLQMENEQLMVEVQKIWEMERLMGDMIETDYKIRTRLGIPFPEDWPGFGLQLGPEPDPTARRAGAQPIELEEAARLAGSAFDRQAVLFAWPVSQGFISSEFGEGSDTSGRGHTGIDIVAREGTPVRAAFDGTVVVAAFDERYGNLIELEHPGRVLTRYGHNARLVVHPGKVVRKGDVIAYVGSTGRATTGPHLHFEVVRSGVAIDPRLYQVLA